MPTVSICDDAADLRLLMSLTLENEGYEVATHDGGIRTLEGLRTSRSLPDLLLLDVQMPEMDGWSVLAEVRGDPRFDGLRVVMCTVKFSQSDLARAWEMGCDGYLTKPFDLDELCATVAAVTSRTNCQNQAFRDQQRAIFAGELLT
ncbi:response regulator transcription factor [Euzebya tangerina]|uniref:response regulator transcription factor n=1 Tax=Euzebya tangerina TaxID=591198 RepID=UPI0013C2EDD3|nr:response regulator transcription factor [Euzebya tangerina]